MRKFLVSSFIGFARCEKVNSISPYPSIAENFSSMCAQFQQIEAMALSSTTEASSVNEHSRRRRTWDEWRVQLKDVLALNSYSTLSFGILESSHDTGYAMGGDFRKDENAFSYHFAEETSEQDKQGKIVSQLTLLRESTHSEAK